MMSNSPASFGARIRIDITCIVAAFLLLGGLALLINQHAQEKEDNEWVVHTYQVINQLRTIEALLVDAETGVRGYVVTGDTVFLQPYKEAKPRLSSNLKTLPRLISDNPTQQQQTRILNKLAQDKVAVVEKIVGLSPSKPPTYLLVIGKKRMDAVREQVARMVSIEMSLLEKRKKRLQADYTNINILASLLLVLSVLASLLAYKLIQRELMKRREAQQVARNSTELLHEIVHNVPTGIVLYEAVRNSTGEIIDFVHVLSNPANDRLTARTTGELPHASVQERYPTSFVRSHLDEMKQVIETGQPLQRLVNLEYQGIHGWFDVQYTKQKDGVLLTYLDVTALKEAELAQQEQAKVLEAANRELQRSNVSLQSFAYIASHDLQEPLRKIESFGTLLQQEYSNELSQRAIDYLSRMRSSAQRMSLLIRDLLAYSRVSNATTERVPVDFSTLVSDIVDDLDIARQQSGVAISMGELPTVQGDRTQLRQLMQNLLSNAIKFGKAQPDGPLPEVHINSRTVQGADLPAEAEAAASDTYWEISVQDNGIGFDRRYLERMFEVFQRLHTKQEFSGSGIGLAICKRVVENHDGYITARSQPGQGATFLVYLPATVN